jgi:hypothetical protein
VIWWRGEANLRGFENLGGFFTFSFPRAAWECRFGALRHESNACDATLYFYLQGILRFSHLVCGVQHSYFASIKCDLFSVEYRAQRA